MKSILLPILVLCLWLFECYSEDANLKVPSDPASTAMATDFQFDGVWKPKGALLRGILLPPPVLETITLTITDDDYEVSVNGEERSDKGIFIVDETVTPMRMAIKSLSGPNGGRIFLAIYEIKGKDAMRVCYDLSGSAFPKEFKAPKDSEHYLVGCRRQKSDEPAKDKNSEQLKATSESGVQ